jgi:hypothetical protein
LKADEITISIYEIAPTLLDLAGLEYEPKFPFGASVFTNKPGLIPTATHLQFIYRLFRSEMRWNQNVQCTADFCEVKK